MAARNRRLRIINFSTSNVPVRVPLRKDSAAIYQSGSAEGGNDNRRMLYLAEYSAVNIPHHDAKEKKENCLCIIRHKSIQMTIFHKQTTQQTLPRAPHRGYHYPSVPIRFLKLGPYTTGEKENFDDKLKGTWTADEISSSCRPKSCGRN